MNESLEPQPQVLKINCLVRRNHSMIINWAIFTNKPSLTPTKPCLFPYNIVIKLIVKSRLIMSILTKMINYIHFD